MVLSIVGYVLVWCHHRSAGYFIDRWEIENLQQSALMIKKKRRTSLQKHVFQSEWDLAGHICNVYLLEAGNVRATKTQTTTVFILLSLPPFGFPFVRTKKRNYNTSKVIQKLRACLAMRFTLLFNKFQIFFLLKLSVVCTFWIVLMCWC